LRTLATKDFDAGPRNARSDGLYSEGPAQTVDFQEPYLRHLLGFMGITDVTFVHAEKIGYGPEACTASMASARSQIDSITQQLKAA
jgi:FMN-dependent NADH-azoreductase